MSEGVETGHAEFDRSQYQEWVGCNIKPDLNKTTAEDLTTVELKNSDGEGMNFAVPKGAAISLKVRTLTDILPPDIAKPFENDLDAGIVACRIVERFEDGRLKLEIPGQTESIIIAEKQLARPK